MDVLAQLASDPTALPLWLVALFAAGMYPIGMLFGCQTCCEICHVCCRDEVSQIVIDWDLEETGEQVIKETPYDGFGYYQQLFPFAVTIEPDGQRIMPPVLLMRGQTSGGLVYVRLVSNNDDPPTWRVPGSGDGQAWFAVGTQPEGSVSLVDGESLVLDDRSQVVEVQAASLTVVREDFEPSDYPNCGLKSLDINVSEGGKYYQAWAQDHRVFCLGDSGTLVYDIAGNEGSIQPSCGNGCGVPAVSRKVDHFTTSHFNTCAYGASQTIESSFFTFGQYTEFPDLPLLMHTGPKDTDPCDDEIKLRATTTWVFRHLFASQFATPYSCECTKIFTLDRKNQDCSPISGWTTEEECVGPGSLEENLITLSATSCFGSGFSGVATLPEGEPDTDEGPLGAVEIVDPGEGYAIEARIPPVLSITGSGTGADIEVTLEEVVDECGISTWKIDTATVMDGGTGYSTGEWLTVTPASGGVEVTPASIQATTVLTEPTLGVLTSFGSGATATVNTLELEDQPGYYVDSVTVTDGGSGYLDGDLVTFSLGPGDVEFSPAFAVVQTGREEPDTMELYGGTGTSAVFAVEIQSNGDTPPTWGISDVTITDGGDGYLVDDYLDVNYGAGTVGIQSGPTVRVTEVDGNGAILAVSIDQAGQVWKDNGILEAINVITAGRYANDSGVIESVTVTNGGSYYEPDSSGSVTLADVEIQINQIPPSDGSGAVISAQIDDDPTSETFGQIVGLTIEDGGSGYLAVWKVDGPCVGSGGQYQTVYQSCGMQIVRHIDVSGPYVVERAHYLRRACPDYTYEITIEPGGSGS